MSENRGAGREGPGSPDALQLCLGYHFPLAQCAPSALPAATSGTGASSCGWNKYESVDGSLSDERDFLGAAGGDSGGSGVEHMLSLSFSVAL